MSDSLRISNGLNITIWRSHIANLILDIFADAMSNLSLVDQMPPLPECVERAFFFSIPGVRRPSFPRRWSHR